VESYWICIFEMLLNKCVLGFFAISVLFMPAAIASESAWVVQKNSSFLEILPQWGSYSNDEPSAVQVLAWKTRYELGYIKNGALAVEIPFRSLNRAVSAEIVSPRSAQVTSNGFTDLWLGHYYQFLNEPLALTLRTGLSVPLGYNLDIQPILGEGQLNLDAMLLAGYRISNWGYVQAGAGYKLRTGYSNQHIRVVQAQAENRTLEKPADQFLFTAESGFWLHPSLLFSLGLSGQLGLNQSNALSQSSVYFQPRLAWRLNPFVDLSFQIDQAIWSQNAPFLTAGTLGAHFRFGTPTDKATGLRGGESSFSLDTL
jgi:hypothetical protein